MEEHARHLKLHPGLGCCGLSLPGSVSRAHAVKHCLHKDDRTRATWSSLQVTTLEIPPRGRFPLKQNIFPNQLNRRKGTAGAKEMPDLHLRKGDNQKSVLFTHKTLAPCSKDKDTDLHPKPAHQLPSSDMPST